MKPITAAIFAIIIFLTMPVITSPGHHQADSPIQKPLFSFGIVSDVQYCNSDPAGSRFYRSSKTKLKEAVSTIKEGSVSFVINLGDVIDKDFASYEPVMDIFTSSGLKIYHVAGNHDYSVDNSLKQKLPVLSASKDGYYAFDRGNFRFVILNGNELSTYISGNSDTIKMAENYLARLKEKGEVNAVEWNGGFSSRQLTWLKQKLNEAVSEDRKVFLICHFPVIPANIHNLLNYKEVLLLLDNYHNIIAWFNGHNHAGNYGVYNKIHFVTFKGMVETESENSFAIAEVYKNSIRLRGFGREKDQILSY